LHAQDAQGVLGLLAEELRASLVGRDRQEEAALRAALRRSGSALHRDGFSIDALAAQGRAQRFARRGPRG
jgi:hypothetical protein